MTRSRQEINRVILELLSDLNEKHSDLRFGQLLAAAAIPVTYLIDDKLRFEVDFNEESMDILDRMINQGIK